MLTPYAVLLRYDFDICEPLSRERVISLVKNIYVWSENLIANSA